jgi:hypothetical protein
MVTVEITSTVGEHSNQNKEAVLNYCVITVQTKVLWEKLEREQVLISNRCGCMLVARGLEGASLLEPSLYILICIWIVK